MNNSYSYDDMEDYLESRMNHASKLAFENKLEVDHDFAKEFQFYKSFRKVAFELNEQEALINRIKAVENNLAQTTFFDQSESLEGSKKKPSERLRRLSLPMSLAASFLLLATLWGVIYWNTQSYTNQGLLARHFEPFEMTVTNRTTENNLQRALDDGISAFANGSFIDAEKAFLQIPESDPLFVESQYYLAQTYNQLGSQEKSITKFREVVKLGDIRFTERAEWDLVKQYLKMNAPNQQIKAQLQPILNNPEHAFHQNANELNEQLDHFWRKWF